MSDPAHPDRVRWGVLGAARIAREKVIPAMLKAEGVEVVAIASRSEAAARAVADALRIPRAYGDYDSLLVDPDVDAVYVPLPNHMHVEWSILALECGKHVLCEKPLGMDAADAGRLASAAAAHPRLKVMEAFMYRLHPQWREAKRLVAEGAIGSLTTVHTHFSYAKFDPENIRNRPETGGGGLMDIGCYAVSLARFLFGGEPERVVAVVDVDGVLGVDRLVSAVMDFGEGRTATFTCGTQQQAYQRVDAFGRDGRVSLEIPFNAPQDGPCRLWLEDELGVHQTTFDRVDQYTLQAEAFSRAVLEDGPVPIPLSDAVANMRVIDAIRESGREARWVTVAPA